MTKPIFPEIVEAIFWTGNNLEEIRTMLDMDNKDAHFTTFMMQRLHAMKNMWIVKKLSSKMPLMLKKEIFEEYFMAFKNDITLYLPDKNDGMFMYI